jgi:hypothetical protein
VTQADHAALAGAIAGVMGPPLLPKLDAEVVRGIAVHDNGWAPIDAQTPAVNGRPLSFLEIAPRDFIRAWEASIQPAEEIAPIAGAIVSRHFWRLACVRLESSIDGAEDCGILAAFLGREQERQKRLLGSRSREEFEFLTDVLQFCDVLSLYLCCGATEDVEFPQKFGPEPIRLWRESARHPDQTAVCRFDPSPFVAGGADLAVSARRSPANREPRTATLSFLLW